MLTLSRHLTIQVIALSVLLETSIHNAVLAGRGGRPADCRWYLRRGVADSDILKEDDSEHDSGI
jgi:hypothetical protein